MKLRLLLNVALQSLWADLRAIDDAVRIGGKGVIVGRGAHFRLDPQVTLRVRVIAPLELRTARVAARDGLSRDDARAKILRIDGERIAFNKQHYGADISDPSHYDLVVNAGTLGIEGAADLSVRAFRTRFSQG